MEEKPRKPRVIYNPNRNNNSNNNNSDGGVDVPHFTSHLTPHLTSGVAGEVEAQDALAAHLSETFRTEMYWEVHKARHCPKKAGSSLDTSLEEFEDEEDEGEVGDDREAFEDESEDGADGGDEARGGGGGSEESGCETEATLKASGTDREDGSSARCCDTEISDVDGGGGGGLRAKEDGQEEEVSLEDENRLEDHIRPGWREVELFIKEEGEDGTALGKKLSDKSSPLGDTGSYFGSAGSFFSSTGSHIGSSGSHIASTSSYFGSSGSYLGSPHSGKVQKGTKAEEERDEGIKTDANDTDLGDGSDSDDGETDFNESAMGESECHDTDLGWSECHDTDLGWSECHETDLCESECNITDIGGSECNETDIGDSECNEKEDETDEEEDEGEDEEEEESESNRSENDNNAKADPKKTRETDDEEGADEDKKSKKQATKRKEEPKRNSKNAQHGELELERPTREREVQRRTQRQRDERMMKNLRTRETYSRSRSPLKEREEEDTRRTREVVALKTRLVNLRKIIHEKNEEIRELKTRMKIEKKNAMARVMALQRDKQTPPELGVQLVTSAELTHLRRELSALRQEKERLRTELAARVTSEQEKALELRKCKQEHEKQIKFVRAETRRECVRETRAMSDLERTIVAKEKELKEQQQAIHKLECEKLYLGEEIFRITGVEEGFWSDQTLSRPSLTEKERCLVRRNSSLNTQLSRLQLHVKTLSCENNSLKNKMEVELERPLEFREKERHRQREVQVLKKKNSELATITRKLEEKVRSLEKKTKESPSAERRNNFLARQKEKDAMYEKQLLERDREIQRLKVRMKELVRKLTGKNGEITRAQSTLELEQIIRTVAKERLQLERHLAVANEGLSRGEADVARLASLEETNNTLKQQLDDLELLTRQHHTLQRHVQEKDLECVTLKEKLKLKNELCQDLECQLARVIEKNTELTIQNSDLQKQIQELQHVSEECKTLKHTLTQVETDWSSAKVQVGSLQGKVGTLESVLRLDDVYGLADGPRARGGNSLEAVLIQMKEAADKRRELERQHAEALAQLRERQSAISDTSRYNDKDRKASVEVIEALQSKIRELEKKAEAQNLRHEELLLEMQSLKKAQGSPKNSWSRSGSLSADLQSPDSGDVTPDKNLVNGNIPGVLMPQYETDNRVLDVLEIPGKGRCHVYIARYSYDPFQHSPNENPEAELAVNAGDYVLVWGAMDEDGFFDGELLDGRRGLVPSNFVEKLVGEDLIEFHQSVVMGLRDGDESMSTSVPQDLDFISQDESQLIELAANQTRHNAYTSYIDLEDIIEEEEETLGEHVPPPVQLTLERQLNKSILIGWNPPPDAPPGSIESYHVYVNGLLKTTVRASERTRALVEGVDSTKLHRISVRSVTPNRRTSRDAACTMVIGKDAPLGPTSVKATSITSTSAVISWLPSNSNFQHTVCVNNVEVRTVKPGVYRHTITGLSPNTTYRVTIRAKNLRAPQFDEKATRNQDRLSTTIEFRTLPKDPKGLPDPPVDVQVEPGPQDGSLLVTWLPVTINSTGGTSNGAPVTGYAVYADGKKVTEVESPTGDHALIDLTKIPGFEPKQVTVRTKSRDSVSGDSVPSQIPSHFARGRGRGKLEEEEALLHSDMDRPSELSDIAEESETELSDEDMHADGHKPGPHHGLGGPHHGPPGPHHGPPGGPHHGPSGPGGLRDRLLGRRGAPAPGVRTDHLGQTILEHEDNLSDKEIYPGHQQGQMAPQTSIPAIGKGVSRARQITKDPASESHPPLEDDYEVSQGGRGRFDPRSAPPRSHLERGRPPPPPHHNRPMMRDPRDPRDVRDPRDPHYRDGRDPRDPRDRRDPHMRDPHVHRDPRDPRDMRDRYEGDGRHRGEYGRDYPGGRGEGRGGGGRGGGGQGDQHTRIFVALFDYDPPTMSPNPDACDEELGFREGQLIQVTGDKDPDGFYWGELGGRHGYVPCNMVSEVQVDDDRVAQELLKESDGGRRRRDGSVGRRHQGDRWGDIYANMPVKKMIAMYDYDPQELSPNVDSEVELSFQTGDIIYVYGDMDDDGFYMGELGGHRGLVPSNFLQDAPQDYADDHRSRRDTLDPRDRAPPPGQSGRGPGPGAHGPPPPPRPDQRDRRKGYEGGPGGPGGPPPRPRHHHRGERL